MNRGGRAIRAVFLGLMLAFGAFVIGACGGGSEGGSNDTVKFGTVDWPEAIAKTNVASTIVDALGYETEIQELGVPTVFQGLETGDLDVFVEAWFPTMQSNFDAVNNVESVTTNLDDATFSVAVNQEACDAGVRSHEDLAEFSDRFEDAGTPTIYGLEPGNDGNQVVLDMIANDQYNLGDWKLVESSTNGMLSEVDRRIADGEWAAWTGWEPHWMNNRYDMCLLEDPEEAWGGTSHVETLVNEDFPERFPELYTFFEQMKVSPDIQRDLIDRIDNSGEEPSQVALDWLRDNPDVTENWLAGIEATDGTDGAEALQRYLDERS